MLSTSTLLGLPRELRLLIFEHLFADHGPVLVGFPSPLPWQGKPRKYHPPVTEVSRRIREEALPILYKACERVILLLRFYEGRKQVDQWITTFYGQERIRKQIGQISVQYFEDPHMSTSILIDRNFRIINTQSWVHPLTLTPLKMLGEAEAITSALNRQGRSSGDVAPEAASSLLRRLVEAMLAPLESSRLLQCERMSNLRLHGYSDFQLRFEVIGMLYRSGGQ